MFSFHSFIKEQSGEAILMFNLKFVYTLLLFKMNVINTRAFSMVSRTLIIAERLLIWFMWLMGEWRAEAFGIQLIKNGLDQKNNIDYNGIVWGLIFLLLTICYLNINTVGASPALHTDHWWRATIQMLLLRYVRTGLNIPVLFIESTLQHQLLKVDERHRDGHRLQATVLPNYSHLSLQADTDRKSQSQILSISESWYKVFSLLKK